MTYPFSNKNWFKATWEILDIFKVPLATIKLRFKKMYNNFNTSLLQENLFYEYLMSFFMCVVCKVIG